MLALCNSAVSGIVQWLWIRNAVDGRYVHVVLGDSLVPFGVQMMAHGHQKVDAGDIVLQCKSRLEIGKGLVMEAPVQVAQTHLQIQLGIVWVEGIGFFELLQRFCEMRASTLEQLVALLDR